MNTELLSIINTVCDNADLEKRDDIKRETHLRDDIGFDSINLAELTVRIEEKFGLDVFEDSIVTTVGEILDKLSDKNE